MLTLSLPLGAQAAGRMSVPTEIIAPPSGSAARRCATRCEA